MGWPLDRCHVSGGLARFVVTQNNVSPFRFASALKTRRPGSTAVPIQALDAQDKQERPSEPVSRHGATGRSARADGVRHPPQHAAVLIQRQHLAAHRQQVVRQAATARSAAGAGPIDPHSWCQLSLAGVRWQQHTRIAVRACWLLGKVPPDRARCGLLWLASPLMHPSASALTMCKHSPRPRSLPHRSWPATLSSTATAQASHTTALCLLSAWSCTGAVLKQPAQRSRCSPSDSRPHPRI